MEFPINRRHQGLATKSEAAYSILLWWRFQSIGVTKDWRLVPSAPPYNFEHFRFPINRRHQGLATKSGWALVGLMMSRQVSGFPINRRHQGLATAGRVKKSVSGMGCSFQSIGVTKNWRRANQKTNRGLVGWFPINRRHQELATQRLTARLTTGLRCFQSIGVTKDWRRSINQRTLSSP